MTSAVVLVTVILHADRISQPLNFILSGRCQRQLLKKLAEV
jgi:hypothetical protein